MYKIKFLNGTKHEFETLVGAKLTGADLRGADLRGANLRGAKLTGANLRYANLTGVKGLEAPIVPNLIQTVLAAARTEYERGTGLDMTTWHTCNTTHCMAGWATHLAGEDGAKLEAQLGPSTAGALIWNASCGVVPDFYGSDEDAVAWLEAQSEAV